MELIWKKASNIIIGNNTLTIEIVPANGDTSIQGSWENLTNAVNHPNGNIRLFFIDGKIGLGQGYNNYDWATYWNNDPSGIVYDATSYENEGDVGYLHKNGNTILGHRSLTYTANNLVTYLPVANSSQFDYAAPIEPYWNIENESVYVDIPFFPNCIDLDEFYRLRYIATTGGGMTNEYNVFQHALGDLSINPDASFYEPDIDSIYQVRYINLHEIVTDILLHFRLAIGEISDANVNLMTYIGAGQYLDSYNKYHAFKTYPAPSLDTPYYDFSLSLSGINNLPSSVLQGQTAEGNITITSEQDFNGTFKVYAFDYEDNLSDFNNMLQTSLDEEDAAQYGQVTYSNENYSITAGDSVQVPITYTANEGYSQTDSYSIIILMTSLDSTAYNEHGENAQVQFNELTQSSKIIYTDTPSIQIISQQELPIETYNPSTNLIKKPSDIIFHLLEQELGYVDGVNYQSIAKAREEHEINAFGDDINFNLDFSLFKKIQAKKLISEISNSSKLVTTLSSDILKFIAIKNTYTGNEDISMIHEHDVIKYNFKRTPIKDILTQVEIKYDYDIGRESYLKSTGKIEVHDGYFKSGKAGDWAISSNNYYGVKQNEDGTLSHIDSEMVIENNYIKDDATARELGMHILHFHQNQHNVVEITLPLKYFNLEVGDLVEFDKMILGKKVYGEKYVLEGWEDMPVRAGQYILPLFMVTETNKSINSVKIKAIQLHHMSYDMLIWKEVPFMNLYTNNWLTSQYGHNVDGFGEGQLGDVNQDGLVDILDLVTVINRIVGADEFTEEELYHADYNQDGYVNVLDVVKIVDHIVNE